MRSFIKVFLFLIFGTALGMDGVFPKLKNAKQDTLVVFNCEGVVFSYLDAAFSGENQKVWADFSEKRANLDTEMNIKIDRALFYAPKEIADMRYKQDFKDLSDQGANVVFVYQINEDRMKFLDEWMIKSFITSILREVGLNLDENSSVKLLITDPKKISSDIAEIAKDFAKFESGALSGEKSRMLSGSNAESGVITVEKKKKSDNKTYRQKNWKSKSIKKIILVHEGSLNLDKKQINLPIEEMLINPRSNKVNITKDQMMQQMEILRKSGEWMDDVQIQRITNLSDEEKVYELCKRSIMDVCPCHEINEEEIYKKIATIVEDKKALEHLEETIDDFQEIYNTLPNIFHYVGRVYFWKMCLKLGLEEKEAIDMLKQVKQFYFNEHEVREAPHKILKGLGCGIHWRDMAKYEFIRDFLMTGEKITKAIDSQRHKTYMKILDMIFDRVSSNMKYRIEDQKGELIRILYENKVENKKIMDIFKISEEKLKNIIAINSLKNEEAQQKSMKKMKKY